MRGQIEALHAEIRRLVERLDKAESLLQEAAVFCPRREAFRPMIRDTERDLRNRIDAFLSEKS
jgi:hypothetical protein